jgi:hypothetical protein
MLSADDDLEGEELVDDEELLTEEDRQRPAGAWGLGWHVAQLGALAQLAC